MNTQTAAAAQAWTVKSAVEQIESCAYECEAGPLANNIAWRFIKAALAIGPEFWPGQKVYYEISAKVDGVTLSKWVPYWIVGTRMEGTTEARIWTYVLSNDPPGPWHYGEAQHVGIHGDKLRIASPVEG